MPYNHDMTSQTLLQNRKQRWIDFYDLSQPPRHMLVVRYLPGLGPRPWPRPDNLAERIEWAWRKYNLQMEALPWLDDDTVPYLEVFTGTEIAAAAFDCPVHYPDNDMPFAMPILQTAGQVAAVRVPGLDHPAIAPLFHIAETLRARAGDEALLHIVDLQSPMDTAALIMEKTAFYPAMIEAPEAVHELAAKVQAFLETFLDCWFASFGREFIAHYPDYYMPYGVTCSVDEVGVVSAAMFRQFFLPELEALSKRYGQIGIHCCANARHQWQNFKRVPNLRLMNINQPQAEVQASVAAFAQHCALWPIPHGEGASWTMDSPLPPGARTVFEVVANSRDEALRAVEKHHFRYGS
jgi:hypothetical protein